MEATLFNDSNISESKINEYKLDDNNYNNQNNQNNINNKFSLLNKQKIIMNNYKESIILNEKFILNNIYSTDEEIYSQLYKQINNPYQKRLNTMILLLKSEIKIPFNNMEDILKFFSWLSPFNNEFNLGSKDWTFKSIKLGNKHKFLLKNSISKKDIGRNFYLNYIDLIKKKLSESNVSYYYFEFKSKRFNKIKDIIWAFDM